MIKINNIKFHYQGQKALVFDGFNLQLEEGRIYGLLGKNGMGKSTLLYLICGLLRPTAGEVTCDGISVCQRRPELLKDIFFVTEEFNLPAISLHEYVRYNGKFYPRFSQEILLNSLLDFGLTDDIRLNELSMGQKKKVYISFALATQSRYLFMDEPTNGLDIPSKTEFRRIVSKYMTEGRTVIISTHQVHDIEPLLNHVLLLHRNSLLVNSPVSEIKERYTFKSLAPGMMIPNVLYSEPSSQGEAVLTYRQDGDAETPLNLELLFNYKVSENEQF